MAFFHLSCDALQRSNGRSSVAAVAYITGSSMHDERQDKQYDYSRRERILFTDTILPDGSRADKDALWNAVEKHHKRGDAVTARTIEIALPLEVGVMAESLATKFAHEVASRYGVGVTYAIHRSREKKNIHAHYMLTACDARNGIESLGKKVAELDPIHCKRHGIETAAEVIRPYWQDICNQYLENAESEQRIDHRSHKARGLITTPQIHIGFGWDKEYRKMLNEWIRESNKLMTQIHTQSRTATPIKSDGMEKESSAPIQAKQKESQPKTIGEAVEFMRKQMYAIGIDKASEKQLQHWKNELATLHNKLMTDTLPKVREHVSKATATYEAEKRAYFMQPENIKQRCLEAVREYEQKIGMTALLTALDKRMDKGISNDRGNSR